MMDLPRIRGETLSHFTTQAVLTHQPSGSPAANRMPVVLQFPRHAWAAIGAFDSLNADRTSASSTASM